MARVAGFAREGGIHCGIRCWRTDSGRVTRQRFLPNCWFEETEQGDRTNDADQSASNLLPYQLLRPRRICCSSFRRCSHKVARRMSQKNVGSAKPGMPGHLWGIRQRAALAWRLRCDHSSRSVHDGSALHSDSGRATRPISGMSDLTEPDIEWWVSS